ncbi:hypothetical protein SynA15127_02431 [Synechococcus sp. A15-127]|nr:hypothetical protein SynA15127_02431 [Synechococcus sp. A15-127]
MIRFGVVNHGHDIASVIRSNSLPGFCFKSYSSSDWLPIWSVIRLGSSARR